MPRLLLWPTEAALRTPLEKKPCLHSSLLSSAEDWRKSNIMQLCIGFCSMPRPWAPRPRRWALSLTPPNAKNLVFNDLTPLRTCSCQVDVLYRKGDDILLNKQQGYLLRTKKLGTDEGSVTTGYAVLDSPFLVDSWPLAEKSSSIYL